MKVFGSFFFLFLPAWGFSQTAAVDTIGNERPAVVHVPDMYKNFSTEDMRIINNLGPNKVMRTDVYLKEFRNPEVESPVNTETDPK